MVRAVDGLEVALSASIVGGDGGSAGRWSWVQSAESKLSVEADAESVSETAGGWVARSASCAALRSPPPLTKIRGVVTGG